MEKKLSINLPLQVEDLKSGMIFQIVSVLAFFTPFLLGHPQWLVGTAVNACLFLSAVLLPRKFYLPVIVLPSLGVLARGLIFGPFTPFLFYFLPFIWLGNLILVLLFRKLFEGERFVNFRGKTVDFAHVKYFFAAFCASAAKFFFLLIAANVYFSLGFVPRLFITAMGLNQLATALAGGIISFVIIYFYGKFKSGSKGVI